MSLRLSFLMKRRHTVHPCTNKNKAHIIHCLYPFDIRVPSFVSSHGLCSFCCDRRLVRPLELVQVHLTNQHLWIPAQENNVIKTNMSNRDSHMRKKKRVGQLISSLL